MTEIGTIRPLLFDENLIIALSSRWIDKFTKIPEFEVIIDNKGRLCIVSLIGVNQSSHSNSEGENIE